VANTSNNLSNAVLLKLEVIAKNKYEEEKKREESLITQASSMQTVFAVSSAALFMLLPVLISYRGNLSLVFFFINVSLVTASLVSSFVFATIAQWRFKIRVLPTEQDVREGLINRIKQKKVSPTEILELITEDSIEQYRAAQEDREKRNAMRVKCIKISMYSFLASIFFCLVFYFLSIYYLWIC